jgi:dihydroxyacetone kinase-like protein
VRDDEGRRPRGLFVPGLAPEFLAGLLVQRGDEVIAFVNSMGGTPLSELYAVYNKLSDICGKKGLKIVRKLIGPYITSLEMQGVSITLLRADAEILKYWDAPVHTPALRWGI